MTCRIFEICLAIMFLVLLTGCATDIQAVNTKVNAYKYQPEPAGQDVWKSPAQFYADGGGDCEDSAIAKMSLLPDHDTKLVVGVLKSGQAHAVLLVDGVYVLDNRFNAIRHWSSYKRELIKYYYSSGAPSLTTPLKRLCLKSKTL